MRVGHWLQMAVTVLFQCSVILRLVTSQSAHVLKWEGPYSFAPQPVETSFASLATHNVSTGPAASALWGACEKCSFSGPAPDLRSQNSHFKETPKGFMHYSWRNTTRRHPWPVEGLPQLKHMQTQDATYSHCPLTLRLLKALQVSVASILTTAR